MAVNPGHVATSLRKISFLVTLLTVLYILTITVNSFDKLSVTADNTVNTETSERTYLHDRVEQLENELRSLRSSKSASNSNFASELHPAVKFLPENKRKRILVTGGAGFVGSHLVDKLMLQGHEVTVLDNFFTGRKRNVEHWIGHQNFELLHHDVVEPIFVEVDEIYHLACPASPPHYMHNPIKTIKTSSIGTLNMLGLAKRVNARMLLASTSEVYGDPEVHPQDENYWGNVNPNGPRACYDEGKRVAETMCYAYERQGHVDVRVARIFNTFGPRMHMNDGRVVSNFILQCLQNKDITVYGTGSQTRSFQYVTDLVDGMIKLMQSEVSSPVNIGNPDEHTILEFATIIKDLTTSKSKIVHEPATEDDPQRRKPDISKAKRELEWEPKVNMLDGLKKTIEYFSNELKQEERNKPNVFLPHDHFIDLAG